jgi:GH3 auxin-responsive promoter
MTWAAWLNTAWMLKCVPEARAFQRATRRVRQTQAALLAAILRRNRDTEFGRARGFSGIASVRAYQESVPPSTYEDYAPAIERIAAGQAGVLTADPVQLLEPTSGTTCGEKLIPYTVGLRRQFQRAVAVWIHDLFRHRPVLRQGRAYWSISPALGPPRRTAAGIPIGFDEDAAYLGTFERWALDRLLVKPPPRLNEAHLETFRYAMLLHLLRAEDLTLISVWNPTFVTALLEPLPVWHDRLCADLRQGTFSPPGVPGHMRQRGGGVQDPGRAAALQSIFGMRAPLAEKLRLIWPRLALVSCWADAAAGRFLPALRALFPAVEIQPKGLLATEGCVSFPLLRPAAPVLAVRSHFFEFQEEHAGACRLAHELEPGGRYRVILTTAGGLYRYQLRDEVEVVGFENRCPLLRFLGKADRVSDLVGEKLAEPHVRAALERAFMVQQLVPTFALLVPVLEPLPHYRLYVQGIDVRACILLQARLQAGLEENPYYRNAVQLGQLAPVEIHVLAPDTVPAWRIYERHCLARGQRAGNIKPALLDAWPGWPDEFAVLQENASG